jgi:hypothetical protein
MTEERVKSPSVQILRASAKRVLKMAEAEIARQGGGAATIYTDTLKFAVRAAFGARRWPSFTRLVCSTSRDTRRNTLAGYRVVGAR